MSRILSSLRQEAFKANPYVELFFLHRDLPRITLVPSRTKYYHNRHRDPKYRVERARKVWRIDLPDFDHMLKEDQKLSPDEVRTRLKEKGVAPPNQWDEREIYTPCTFSLIEPFKPYDGDGKSSSLLDKVKSPLSTGTEMVKTRRSLNVIKSFEGDDFDLKEFAKLSVDIYKNAHQALVDKNEDKIFDFVTEHCFPIMAANLNRHTLIWKYLDEIEPPNVVQVRVADLISKSNKYAQITVRFHSKQIMAVYDRHGRLIMGSPSEVKEVLEYIVFEKYLANEYGLWRLHDRIRPEHAKVIQDIAPTRLYITNK